MLRVGKRCYGKGELAHQSAGTGEVIDFCAKAFERRPSKSDKNNTQSREAIGKGATKQFRA